MTWQYPTEELEALDGVLREAVLTHLYPGEAGSISFIPLPDGQGRYTDLPDGTRVRIDVKGTPATQTRHGQRACAGIRVAGVMAMRGVGHRIVADVIVDVATRAVLSCEVRWEGVGRISGSELRR